jgi:t-SNARE complex subunit (syntaxin)
MRQVAILVHEQGEMIDNIYKNVSEARDYVGKAEAVLVK